MKPVSPCRLRILATLLTMAAFASTAAAQNSTGSIQGAVRDQTDAILPGASVLASNTESGFQYSAVTREDGSYNLNSVPPGTYTIKVSIPGFKEQSRTLRLQVGQTLNLDFKLTLDAMIAESVTVVGTIPLETRTPEIATNVTQEQIQFLPQNSRNFLNFAALAPGVRLSTDEQRKEVTAGALASQQTNVFIDGVSLKNDVLLGGVVGQDASRGNPFPQNAVQEFRVITQNYKAEYQKASSAIISAITKSGGNTFHGDAFGFYQGKGLVAADPFAEKRGEPKPDYKRLQYGASLSGPIVRDRAHFFLSYEGNDQDRSNSVFFGSTAVPPALAAQLQKYLGTETSPFRSDLYFGKLTYQVSPTQLLELSGQARHETDIRDFGGQTSFENADNVKNDVKYATAKHRLAKGTFVNEATFSFLDFKWNPVPLNPNLVGQEYRGILRIGGRDTTQDFTQKRASLRDDFTLFGIKGMGTHVVKLGANLDFLSYDVSKQLFGNPLFTYRSDISLDFPAEASYGVGNPDLSSDNREFGVYAQDDWKVTKNFELNLGVRWDYESEMLNNSYVTPADVRNALSPFLPAKYFTDGTQRKPFYGAIQPRVGFSWDLAGDGKTTVFGGVGRYYDRVLYNYILDERFRLQYAVRKFLFSANGGVRDGLPTIPWDPAYLSAAGLNGLIARGTAPNPEVFLIDNNTKPLSSTQWSAGLRRTLGPVLASATYTGVRSDHGFTFLFGNRRPDGNCCQQLAPNYGNVLISSDAVKTWYDALYVTVDKPFTASSKWGASVAYTLGWAKQIGGDLFSLDFPTVEAYPRYPTPNDERHRLVASGIFGLPGDVRISTFITYGSGLPYTITDASLGFGPNQLKILRNEGRADTYQSFDFRLEKAVGFGGPHRVGLVAEVFNAFNHYNYTDYNGFIPPLPEVNANFATPGRLTEPGRRFQFGVNYSF